VSIPARLAAFAGAALLTLGGGYAVGAVVGPIEAPAPVEHGTHEAPATAPHGHESSPASQP
jgi:hypothetical protein